MGQQETFHKESSEYGCVKPVSSDYVMELERDELEKRQANNGFSLKDLREEASSTSTSSSFLVFMQ